MVILGLLSITVSLAWYNALHTAVGPLLVLVDGQNMLAHHLGSSRDLHSEHTHPSAAAAVLTLLVVHVHRHLLVGLVADDGGDPVFSSVGVDQDILLTPEGFDL